MIILKCKGSSCPRLLSNVVSSTLLLHPKGGERNRKFKTQLYITKKKWQKWEFRHRDAIVGIAAMRK